MNWQEINSFALWFSAFGSIFASVVALRLASRERRLQLVPSIEYATTYPIPSEGVETVIVEVANVGHRPGNINGFELCVGRPGFHRWFLLPPQGTSVAARSTHLPTTLNDGERAHLFYDIELLQEVLSSHCRNRLSAWILLRRLRIQVNTTIGATFRAPLGRFLRGQLWRDIKEGKITFGKRSAG